jgi:hypothetical protein
MHVRDRTHVGVLGAPARHDLLQARDLCLAEDPVQHLPGFRSELLISLLDRFERCTKPMRHRAILDQHLAQRCQTDHVDGVAEGIGSAGNRVGRSGLLDAPVLRDQAIIGVFGMRLSARDDLTHATHELIGKAHHGQLQGPVAAAPVCARRAEGLY